MSTAQLQKINFSDANRRTLHNFLFFIEHCLFTIGPYHVDKIDNEFVTQGCIYIYKYSYPVTNCIVRLTKSSNF